ncbi:unnamed protein product [Anisakis simplex]|uniref:Phospholipid scramblase n=1 Tax=Anisakis simplex TaxID=6269 RepID=A0A0M3J854_ANISI|nr:unnamed protein product [Anisakis simplex]
MHLECEDTQALVANAERQCPCQSGALQASFRDEPAENLLQAAEMSCCHRVMTKPKPTNIFDESKMQLQLGPRPPRAADADSSSPSSTTISSFLNYHPSKAINSTCKSSFTIRSNDVHHL